MSKLTLGSSREEYCIRRALLGYTECLKATDAIVDKESKAWAHEHCVEEHRCPSHAFREFIPTDVHSDVE